MKINYIETKEGKLFSFFTHDFKQASTGEFIDGGFEYTRYSGELKKGEIKDLIVDIREQFVWGKNYDKENNRLAETQYILLKNITTDHIIGILIYFTNALHEKSIITTSWKAIHLIFLNELKYRCEQDI